MRPWLLVILLAAHAGLGIALMRSEGLSTIHAYLTLGIGVAAALMSRSPAAAVCGAAYATGAECVWRLTHAQIFWEFGKYSVVVILIAALYRMNRPRIHGPAVLYLLLLLPSAVITFSELPLEDARQRVSFNLSGPLLMAVAVVVLSNVRISRSELHRAFACYMMPVASAVAIALYGIATATNLRFTNDSNAVTSGGFGPNQVSAALGLAAFFALLCLLDDRYSLRLRVVLVGALLMYTVQSALTFSRSGLYTTGVGAALALFYLIRLPAVRARVAQAIPALVLLAFIAWPRIDAFTDGALAERFTDTNLTHRDELAYDDWLIFLDNPLFGAGPGMGQAARMGLAAHTEFSRLLSEHGICGLVAMSLLAISAWRRLVTAGTPLEKAYVLSMVGWSALYMAVNGMRLASPSFMAGLAFLQMTPGRTLR
jgi:O-antigen ligase